MYYYISFLRPPPVQASVKADYVTITPQVANDLRTELFPKAVDIFYSWSSCQGNPQTPSNTLEHTKPAKLTTWRQSSAYKESRVPLPPAVRPGDSWRLALSSSALGHYAIPLRREVTRAAPFPVISMPVAFVGSRVAKPGKSEEIERVFYLPASGMETPLVVREQTSFDLDKKLWDSGIGLSVWLADLSNDTIPPFSDDVEAAYLVSELKDALTKNGAVVELGAGTGVVSLTLAAMLTASRLRISDAPDTNFDTPPRRLWVTDLASALPLLSHNIAANAVKHQAGVVAQLQALALDWDDDLLPDEVMDAQQHGLDLVVMADVTYNTASFPSLVSTLASLAGPCNSHKAPVVLLGYKERDPSERTLWMMVLGVGFHFIQVGTCAGAGGEPVEIWLARKKET